METLNKNVKHKIVNKDFFCHIAEIESESHNQLIIKYRKKYEQKIRRSRSCSRKNKNKR